MRYWPVLTALLSSLVTGTRQKVEGSARAAHHNARDVMASRDLEKNIDPAILTCLPGDDNHILFGLSRDRPSRAQIGLAALARLAFLKSQSQAVRPSGLQAAAFQYCSGQIK